MLFLFKFTITCALLNLISSTSIKNIVTNSADDENTLVIIKPTYNEERIAKANLTRSGQYWGMIELFTIVSDRSFSDTDFWDHYSWYNINFYCKQDFNEGAGGKYIYLAGREGWTDYPITMLKGVVKSDSGYKTLPQYDNIRNNYGEPWPGIDYNKGARGNYVYLWQSNREPGNRITELQVVVAGYVGASASKGFTKVKNNDNNKDIDFNSGAGGKYIYLAYKK